MSEKIAVKSIRLDGGTQPRAGIYNDLVTDYAADMKAGNEFPAITVFFDGENYWCADGFHRVQAAQRANITKIKADVRQGTRRDAVLYSVGANADHGLRRSNQDKHRAVMTLLNDDEWGKWSSREIARRCSVSHTYVEQLRASLATVASENESRTYTTKHGVPTTMQTGNIGKAVRYERDAEADDSEPEGVNIIAYAPPGTPHGEYNFTDDGDPIIYGDSFYPADYVGKRVVVEPFPSKDAAWAKYPKLQAIPGTNFHTHRASMLRFDYFPPDAYAEQFMEQPTSDASGSTGTIDLFAEPPSEDGDTKKMEPPTPEEPEQLPFTGEPVNDPDPLESGEYEVTPFGRKPKKIEAKPESSTVSPISAEAGGTIDTATSLREIAAKLSNSGPDTPISAFESLGLTQNKPAPAAPPVEPPAPPKSINWLSLLPLQLVSAARTVLTDVDCSDPSKQLSGRVLIGFGGEHTQATMLALQALSGHLISGHVSGRISQAILIAPAWTSDVWFGNLWAHPICFCRVPMKLPTANGEAFWSEEAVAVTYFGHNIMGFAEEFDPHGPVTFSTRMLRRVDVDITDFFAEDVGVR